MSITATTTGSRAVTVSDGRDTWTWHFPLTPDGKDAPAYMEGPEIREFLKFDQLQKTAAGFASQVGLIPNPKPKIPLV